MSKRRIEFITSNGGSIECDRGSKQDRAYINFCPATGCMFGVQENTGALRRFLQTTLNRLKADAKRRRK